MTRLRALLRDTRGGPAAEFALVLPLILLFLFGIIDVGRYVWEVNRAEKATQTGARWAAVTDMIPSGLATFSFATTGTLVPAGTPVPASLFPKVTCTSASCICASSCAFGPGYSGTAFTNLVTRMDDIKADIKAANVIVEYSHSGLGFAGDPNGSDVAPLITVRLQNMKFVPLTLILFNGSIDLPDFSYSLTMEDGSGDTSN